jgi:hypothetical protein
LMTRYIARGANETEREDAGEGEAHEGRGGSGVCAWRIMDHSDGRCCMVGRTRPEAETEAVVEAELETAFVGVRAPSRGLGVLSADLVGRMPRRVTYCAGGGARGRGGALEGGEGRKDGV